MVRSVLCYKRGEVIEDTSAELFEALGPSTTSVLEIVDCLPYADVGGERAAAPFDVIVSCEARYEDIVSIAEASSGRGAIASWLAFDVVEQRAFERELVEPRSQTRWKKLAVIRRRPGLETTEFRRRYAQHFVDCREHATHCWKYRQNDVRRSGGFLDAEVDGISEFWRNSEALLQINQYPDVVEHTDSFVDHRIGVRWPIVVFGVERLVERPT
jgi:hypothetical protein